MQRRFTPAPITLESRLTPSPTVTTLPPPIIDPAPVVPIQAPLPPPVFPAPVPVDSLPPLPPDPPYVPSWGERIQAVLDSLYSDPDSWRIGTGG